MTIKSEPVVLINAFEVPEGSDEAFLQAWARARAFLSTQHGYLSTRLHRSIAPGADFRFVNVALWQSPQDFRAATSRPEFAHASIPFPFHASLYEVVQPLPRFCNAALVTAQASANTGDMLAGDMLPRRAGSES